MLTPAFLPKPDDVSGQPFVRKCHSTVQNLEIAPRQGDIHLLQKAHEGLTFETRYHLINLPYPLAILTTQLPT